MKLKAILIVELTIASSEVKIDVLILQGPAMLLVSESFVDFRVLRREG